MDILYKKYKKRKIGPCNICQKTGRLTWDHVPPKGGIDLAPVEIDRVTSHFISNFKLENPEISNDGLKYRTLCSRCNSILGNKYDPALNDFAKTLAKLLNSSLYLPETIKLSIRPTAVIRAVLGHLLTARLSSVDSFFDPTIRELVLNDEIPIPKNISVFYWIHPFAQQIVFRDALMPSRIGNFSEFQRIGFLKYFPLGFLVSDISEYEGLGSLSIWRNEPSSKIVEISVRLNQFRGAFWPEAPSPGNFLMFGADGLESLMAHPNKKLIEEYRQHLKSF